MAAPACPFAGRAGTGSGPCDLGRGRAAGPGPTQAVRLGRGERPGPAAVDQPGRGRERLGSSPGGRAVEVEPTGRPAGGQPVEPDGDARDEQARQGVSRPARPGRPGGVARDRQVRPVAQDRADQRRQDRAGADLDEDPRPVAYIASIISANRTGLARCSPSRAAIAAGSAGYGAASRFE